MIAVITHGPGTLTGQETVTVSTLLVPGSVTLKVSGPTCWMIGAAFQRLRAGPRRPWPDWPARAGGRCSRRTARPGAAASW